MRALALSGPLCAGKTTVASALAREGGWSRVTARQILMAHAGRSLDRVELQQMGRQLEAETAGEWLAQGVADAVAGMNDTVCVVDSARTLPQIDALRLLLDDDLVVIHVSAHYETRRARFRGRRPQDPVDEQVDFDDVSRDGLELASETLRMHADFVFDTTHVSSGAVTSALVLLMRDAGLLSPTPAGA